MTPVRVGRTRFAVRALQAVAWLGLALAAGVLAPQVQAGPLFLAGTLEGNTFTPAKDVAEPWYAVRYGNVAVAVEDDAARFRLEETIDGPERSVAGVALIPLPDSAAGDVRVTLGAPGATPVVLADARMLSADKARPVIEALARGSGSTRVLTFAGRPVILVPRIQLQGKSLLTVSYRDKAGLTQGVRGITCPLPSASCSASAVDRVGVTVTVKTRDPLRSVFSPTHPVTVTRPGLNEATASLKLERWTGLDDFRLYWVADRDDLGLRVLAYRAPGEKDGYFMLLGNPTGAAGKEKVAAKDVLFVLDTSGSMRGEKIEQARAAIDYCLEHLNAGDRFNVVTFGTEVKGFKDDLVARTPQTVAAAREFIDGVVANGRTNIAGALAKALAGQSEAGRPRIVIFLTDGAPTAGELNPDRILEQVKKANSGGAKVFVMGVGHDVNAHLLDHLAELTDGSSEYVAPREELDAKIAALYDRLSHPVLSAAAVSFGDLATSAVLPPRLPVLFKGSEIMMVGRYREGGQHTVTVSGTLAGQPVKYTVAADLPGPDARAGEVANEFLAPLWAARQIGYLLQEIRLHGEKKELIEEVVRLSKQYGIVTEYTEFLAHAGAPLANEEIYREAAGRLSAARAEKAGQWAVNQAFNDKALQNRAFGGGAGGFANSYRDRKGAVTEARNISQVGRRAYYLQDGQWVDAEEAGARKVRVIKLFSPEYFELLRTSPEFAQAQRLGWAMSVNVGDQRIVVEKDGKQKDDALKAKPPAPENEGAPNPGQQQEQFNRFRNQLPLQNLQRPNGPPNLRAPNQDR